MYAGTHAGRGDVDDDDAAAPRGTPLRLRARRVEPLARDRGDAVADGGMAGGAPLLPVVPSWGDGVRAARACGAAVDGGAAHDVDGGGRDGGAAAGLRLRGRDVPGGDRARRSMGECSGTNVPSGRCDGVCAPMECRLNGCVNAGADVPLALGEGWTGHTECHCGKNSRSRKPGSSTIAGDVAPATPLSTWCDGVVPLVAAVPALSLLQGNVETGVDIHTGRV